MNIHFALQGINFEWDPKKASANQKKHGVSFNLACEVFFDPLLLAVDDEVTDDELREHVIGMTAKWQVLYVIYVLRGESIRIVSARKAQSHERRTYEHQ
ncbi:MAG: BrnT family toxin [Chloroflexota bacterium]